MAEGTHWEWRGFGALRQKSVYAFEGLPLKFSQAPPWDETTDEYIWIPGCEINVKVRNGGLQQGLKLKRFVRREEDLELWCEIPGELFPFNRLDAPALAKLGKLLGLALGKMPDPPLTPAQIFEVLRCASPTPSAVTVVKRRQTRMHSRTVQVELSYIKNVSVDGAPVPLDAALCSTAVEGATDVTGLPPDHVRSAREEVNAGVRALKLRDAGWVEKNCLRAITEWATGARV
jgi:hypothetical protein